MAKQKRNEYPPSYRFVHLRPDPEARGDMEEWDRPWNNNGATIAYVPDTDPDGNPIVLVALAFCHPNDNYSKKMGRVKAAGQLTRLGLNRSLVDDHRYWIMPGDDPRRAAYTVANEVAEEYGYETRS